MRLKKYEFAVIIISLVFVCFTAGYFFGSNSAEGIMKVDKPAKIQVSQGIAEISAANDNPVSPSTTAVSGSSNPAAVNINTATLEELKALPGIGDVLAGRIIAYRTDNGGFSTTDEIMSVYGIGEKLYDGFKDIITIG